MKTYLKVIFLSLVFLSASALQASPLKEMKATIDDLVKIVESHPGDQNLATRRSALEERIKPLFDFSEMAKRSLGAYWKEISEPEQQQFVSSFSKLLAKTYLAKIENVESNMVTVDSEKIRGPKAYVKTTVSYKGDTFPIDYRLLNRDDNWKVYDVLIENIGLVANYRSEFASIIRKDKFAGLMKMLNDKIAEDA